MHFCSLCGNMYYIKLQDEDKNKIIYYCRKCGHESNAIENTNLIISKTTIRNKSQTFHHIINKYTKLDPTLPHIHTMKCINEECESNITESTEPDVIYIKYNEEQIKYVYLCAMCDHIWTNEKM